MKLESERYLAKARLTLDAGRAVYLAGYQPAEAFIFEPTDKATKTHKGAHTQFAHLARDEPSIDEDMRSFLPRTYDMKAICDYELGPDAVIPFELAAAAVADAERFVNCVTGIIDGGTN